LHCSQDWSGIRTGLALTSFAWDHDKIVEHWDVLQRVPEKSSSRRLQVAFWILAGITGMGVAAFQRPKIGSDTQNAYVIMVIWLPLAITGISIVGLMLTMGLRSGE
jgi:uncharacterized membrane protein YidH (DUF202 family)